MMDFAQCKNNYALTELPWSKSIYTWLNVRIEEECICKRLDRVFGNNDFIQEFPETKVQHLIRDESDQCPMACYM